MKFYKHQRPDGKPTLVRQNSDSWLDAQAWNGDKWIPTEYVARSKIGKDNDLEPCSDADARALAPAAFT